MMFQEMDRDIDLKGFFKLLLRLCLCSAFAGFLIFSFQSFLFGLQKLTAIRGGKIYTAGEKGLVENGIILIQGGRIIEIGSQVIIPSEAEVYNFQDKFIMPGIVSPDSNLGIFKQPLRREGFPRRLPESPGKNLAYYPVLYSIYPEHPDYQLALKNGFTTIALSPPPEGISGLGAIIRPYGKSFKDILIKDKAFLKITVYVNTPFWEMMKGSLEEAKKKLDELEERKQEKKKIKIPNKEEREKEKKEEVETKEATKIFMEVLEGKIPLVAECKNPDAILHILALISEYPKIKLIIRGGPDTYKAGVLLKEKNIPIILEPGIETETSFYAPYPERTNYVLKCQGLSLKIALQAGGNIKEQIHFFHYLNKLYHLGVKKDVLLRGATIIPAQLLGVDHLFGSLEKGKKANIVILRDDPLENVPVIEKVILGGMIVQ